MIPSISTERVFFGAPGELPQPLGVDDGVMVTFTDGSKPIAPQDDVGNTVWKDAELILSDADPLWFRALATPGVALPTTTWFFARRIGAALGNDLDLGVDDWQAWSAIRIGDEWITRRLEMTLEIF